MEEKRKEERVTIKRYVDIEELWVILQKWQKEASLQANQASDEKERNYYMGRYYALNDILKLLNLSEQKQEELIKSVNKAGEKAENRQTSVAKSISGEKRKKPDLERLKQISDDIWETYRREEEMEIRWLLKDPNWNNPKLWDHSLDEEVDIRREYK